MRKSVAIFFLSIYLMGVTPLGELCKFPKLYEHFQEHKATNSKITILEFLDMHYFNGDPMDDDYAEDMKLPFKTIDIQMNDFAQLFIELPQLTPIAKTINIHFTKILPLRYLSLVPYYLDSIWQPPQF